MKVRVYKLQFTLTQAELDQLLPNDADEVTLVILGVSRTLTVEDITPSGADDDSGEPLLTVTLFER
jgi:hypothetical protein